MSDYEHRDWGIDEAKCQAQDVRYELDRAIDDLRRDIHSLGRDLAAQGSALASDIGDLSERLSTLEGTVAEALREPETDAPRCYSQTCDMKLVAHLVGECYETEQL